MGIKVTMSQQEASSSAREVMPTGKYLVAVTDGSLKQSQSEKNAGKPYYNMELTIQEGTYAGRKLFTNVMCFEGALYSMTQILKADGVEFEGSNFQVPGHDENEIPELDHFMGREYVVKVSVEPARTDKASGKTYDERNEVKSWFSKKTWKGATAEDNKAATGSSKNPLLPR
jgi:hypothetical protein